MFGVRLLVHHTVFLFLFLTFFLSVSLVVADTSIVISVLFVRNNVFDVSGSAFYIILLFVVCMVAASALRCALCFSALLRFFDVTIAFVRRRDDGLCTSCVVRDACGQRVGVVGRFLVCEVFLYIFYSEGAQVARGVCVAALVFLLAFNGLGYADCTSPACPNNRRSQAAAQHRLRCARRALPAQSREAAINAAEPCAICLEPFQRAGDAETLYTLPCRHAFHTACITQWAASESRPSSVLCPLCRGCGTV